MKKYKQSTHSTNSLSELIRKYPLPAAGLLLILILGGWLLISHFSSGPDLGQGLDYLKARDELDETRTAREVQAAREARLLEKIRNGEVNVFAAFDNSVIIGDSRARGFQEYGYLPANQTLAGIGDQIYKIPDYAETLTELSPDVMYFSFGVNDLESNVGHGEGQEGFGSEYEKMIQTAAAASPESLVAVNSIPDISDDAQTDLMNHETIASTNEEIKEMCERNGWIYIDNSMLDVNHYYQTEGSDGIHFSSDFYPVWAQNMYETVLDAKESQS